MSAAHPAWGQTDQPGLAFMPDPQYQLKGITNEESAKTGEKVAVMSFSKGDVIVRFDATYPQNALVVDGFDHDQNLLAHPMGGGLQLIIPSEHLSRFQIAESVERTPIFRRSSFGIEGVDRIFHGWTDGRLWNGWSMPWFDFEEAKNVATAVCPQSCRYDATVDSFVTTMADSEEEHWPGELVDMPDGGAITLYPVGAGSWIWEEEEPL